MASEYKPNFGVVTLSSATATIDDDPHAGVTLVLSRAAGVTATLPAATGSGAIYRFIVGTTVTSNGYIIRVTGNDTMSGYALIAQDGGDTSVMFETAADSDTVTMNGTTTGGLIGAEVEVIDIAADKWFVKVVSAATGTEATPFSAAVS